MMIQRTSHLATLVGMVAVVSILGCDDGQAIGDMTSGGAAGAATSTKGGQAGQGAEGGTISTGDGGAQSGGRESSAGGKTGASKGGAASTEAGGSGGDTTVHTTGGAARGGARGTSRGGAGSTTRGGSGTTATGGAAGAAEGGAAGAAEGGAAGAAEGGAAGAATGGAAGAATGGAAGAATGGAAGAATGGAAGSTSTLRSCLEGCNDPYEFCKVAACGDTDGICVPLPSECPTLDDPVCGCDGNTYANACVAETAGVSVDYSGKCPESRCYKSETCRDDEYCAYIPCDVETGRCTTRPTACEESTEPVCACDGTTMDSACHAAMEGQSYTPGGCAGSPCWGPEQCKEGTFCDFPGCLIETGTCTPIPMESSCDGLDEPVCGCDGNTYDSPCAADAQSVSVAQTGSC